MPLSHHQTITTEFAKQAQNFGGRGLTLSSAELLNWAVANLPHKQDSDVLDVATGTAHLARALAFSVRSVTGIDATPEMLVQGMVAARENGLGRVHFVRGLAEVLPFAEESFDLTVCRLAIHHYERPARHVGEMVRVCKPGGSVAIIDLIAPDETSVSELYNHYERLRDPSHTKALPLNGLVALLETEGISVDHVACREVTVVVDAWLALTQTPRDRAKTVREALRAELDGGPATGLRPFVEDNELKFDQLWAVVSGQKRR